MRQSFRFLRMYVLPTMTLFGIWALLESFIPLPSSEMTDSNFRFLSPSFFIRVAVSVCLYSIMGLVAGTLSGGFAILASALRRSTGGAGRKRSPVPWAGELSSPGPPSTGARPHPPIVFHVFLAWILLTLGALYYTNRLLPEVFMSSRSLILSAAMSGVLGLFACLSYLGLVRTMGSERGKRIVLVTSRAIGRAMVILIILSSAITAAVYLEERFRDPLALLPGDHPDVILVSIDALRPDHLSCYGYALPTSPAIDDLAGEGVLFTQAYCQSPSSTPSHATMLTGLYPAAHGALSNGDFLSDDVLTLAEIFRAAGYQTGAFLTNPWLNREFGFSQGFDIFVEDGILQSALRHDMCQLASNLWLLQGWDKLCGRDLSFVRAKRWIGNHSDRSFFLFLHLLDPHRPYRPPEGYEARFLPAGADKVNRTIAAYDGEILLVDEKIGSVVEEIKKLGLWENVIICLTSDHGENMGEHGKRFGHGTLYETNIRVPLILLSPGTLPAGRRILSPVETVDIVPTLLSLSGIGVPGLLDGRDLSPLAGGQEASQEEKEDVGSGDGRVAGDAQAPRPIFAQKLQEYAVRRGDWKMILSGADSPLALYDLSEDPLEQTNLAQERHDIVEELLPILSAWMEEGKRHSRLPASRIDRLHPVIRDRLRSLGYLQ